MRWKYIENCNTTLAPRPFPVIVSRRDVPGDPMSSFPEASSLRAKVEHGPTYREFYPSEKGSIDDEQRVMDETSERTE